MIGWLVISILSAFITLGGMVYFYTGAYKPVEIRPPATHQFKMLYKEHVGPYHGINASIEEVEALAAEQKIPCPRTFGEFIDDPLKTEEERLRSHVGCLVDARPDGIPKQLAYKESPAQSYLGAHFEGAPSIGPFVVYPELYSEIDEQGLSLTGPAIEVYTRAGAEKLITEYYLPVSPAAATTTESTDSAVKD